MLYLFALSLTFLFEALLPDDSCLPTDFLPIYSSNPPVTFSMCHLIPA